MSVRKVISSWWLTAAICAVGAAAYVAYAETGDAPYASWSQLVMHTAPGALLYFLMLVNLIAINARIALDALRPQAGRIEEMDEHAAVQLTGHPHEAIPAWLRSNGFHVTLRHNEIIGTRGRWSFLPGLVLRTGLVIMLLALGASVHLRKSESRVMHVSDAATLLGREVKVRTISATLPADYLQVGDRSEFELGDLSADLTVDDRDVRATSGYAARAGGLYLRATDFGYRVPLIFKHVAVEEDLDVLPPGKKMLATAGVYVSLEPAKTITKGLLTGKSYDLRSPRFRVKARALEGEFVLGPGESSPELALGPAMGYFVRISAVHDPALIWVYLGGATMLAGIVMMLSRFVWYRRRIEARTGGPDIMIGQSSELYGSWNVERFRLMLSGLAGPPARQDERGPSSGDQEPSE